MTATTVAALLPELRAFLGDRLSTTAAIREHHGKGEGIAAFALPDAVVFPHTNEEVAAVARLANAAKVPLVPFGAGTSLEGHVVPVRGGISVDLSGMDRILDVSAESLDCRVQAGVTREALNADLRASGLFFPIDPGANASIGGMCATRASGTAAVRYQTMRENVLGLTVVLADGRILRTGTRARKSATGYDLTRLFVGSEGTLGFITEIQLKLHGLPESIAAAVCQFESVPDALATVIAVLQSGIPIARVELLNAMQMRMSIRYSQLNEFAEKPTLFLEFQGSPAAVAEQIETVQDYAREFGGGGFAWAHTPEDRSRLWKARHMGYFAILAYRPGCAVMGTDACVPISELAACIEETEADIAASGLVVPITGHVGDGNFHLGIVYDPTNADETARAEKLAVRTGERALRLGGTVSGEHGIGLHKLDLAAQEHGVASDLMWDIKRAFDPNGIMNPGKLLPPPHATRLAAD